MGTEMQTARRNFPIALITLLLCGFFWYAYGHLSTNTLPVGSFELNDLCDVVLSKVLVVFVILTGAVLFAPQKKWAIALAIVLVLSDWTISASIYEIRNSAAQHGAADPIR